MRCFKLLLFNAFILLIYSTSQLPANAAIVTNGNVTPNDASVWTSSTHASIGNIDGGAGSVMVTEGDSILSYFADIGTNPNATGTVTISDTGSAWTSSYLRIGYKGNGKLIIINSGTVISDSIVSIGSMTNSTGEVNINGNGSTWTSRGSLNIGQNSTGKIKISDGGTVISDSIVSIGRMTDSTGEVNINGNGSTWTSRGSLSIGESGSGKIKISDGGTVISDSIVSIGRMTDSTGEVNIKGNGATWTSRGSLGIGKYGTGKIKISDGGTVISDSIVSIGSMTDSIGEVNINGNGSTWISKGSLSIGRYGTGKIKISDGGTFTGGPNTITTLGNAPDSTGELNIDGIDSIWTSSGILYIGESGTGKIKISDGGTVISDSIVSIGRMTDSIGELNINGNGSTWTSKGSLSIGQYGTGKINISNSGTATSYSAVGLASEPDSIGKATVDGNGSTWTNNCNLFVGLSGSGTLNIKNDGLVSIAETLTVDRNGDGDSFINISDGGMLALFGKADNSLDAFFDLIQGTDAIQWWDPEFGNWNSLTTATEKKDYTLEYFDIGDLTGYTVLTVTAPVPEPACVTLLLTLFAAGMVAKLRKQRK